MKKHLALTTSKTTMDWPPCLHCFVNVDLLTQVTRHLSPVDIARLILMSCKTLHNIPVLAPILMYQLELRLPYAPQELLLYKSLMKAPPLIEKEISKCQSLLEEYTVNYLVLLDTEEPLSSDKQSELIKLYHLSNSPLSPLKNNKSATQLTNETQSYINDNLSDENKALFKMIDETHSGDEEKDPYKEALTQMLIDLPLLVLAKNEEDDTPLHLAAWDTPKAVAKLLIDKGADVNAKDDDGDTPLIWAALDKNIEVVELLIANWADVNGTVTHGFYKGKTPEHDPASKGITEIEEQCLTNEAEMNATDNDGDTTLHWAAQEGLTYIARILLDKGAYVNATTQYGSTPLHFSAQEGHTDIVRILLDNGADVNATTRYGATPLQLAERYKRTDIANLLRPAEVTA